MLTNKDYCDYKLVLELKELGYDYIRREGLIHLYDAQKWLREEKNIEVNASFYKEDDGWIAFIQRLDYPDLYGTDVFSTVYNTYEEALSEGLRTAIEILKEKLNEKDI